jgi:RNA polymerase sigma-70 factor, ECF subfamily
MVQIGIEPGLAPPGRAMPGSDEHGWETMTADAAGYRVASGLSALAAAVMQSRRGAPTGEIAAAAAGQAVPGVRPDEQSRPSPRPRPSPAPGLEQGTGTRPSPSPRQTPRPSPRPTPRPRPGSAPSPTPRPGPGPGPSRLSPKGTPPAAGTGPSGPVAPAGPAQEQEPDVPPDDASAALVRRAQEGDAEAFGQLYDRYVDLVFRYVYYRVGDRSQAEDFTSETFLRALRRIGSFAWTGRDIGAWFVTIARNIVLDHVKSSRYRLEVTTADMLDEDRAEDGPEDAVLDKVTSAELMRCVRMLNPEQQECIVLRFLQGMSVAETAAIMGKNDGAIKALQHRAVRRLATLLPEGIR